MVQRINTFSTIRTGITHKSTHIHFYYSRPDIAETTITTTIQLVILNLNVFSYIHILYTQHNCGSDIVLVLPGLL